MWSPLRLRPNRPNPNNPDLLAGGDKRRGHIGRYFGLQLYYVGYGANNNKTVRFRRYTGDGHPPLKPEHDLLGKNVPNQARHVQILIADGVFQYWTDGKQVYDIKDPEPYTSGWFGFRTYANHMKIDNFRVWRINAAG